MRGDKPGQPSRMTEIIVGMAFGGEIVPVGLLRIQRNVTAELDRSTGRFRYAASYLSRPDAIPLDPVQLPLKEGEFGFARFGGLPSCIRDAAPDNWGRMLIRRYYYARGIEGPISEADYLLASPRDRVGNLHFATGFSAAGVPTWNKTALRPEALNGTAELKRHVIDVLQNPRGDFNQPYPPALDSLLTGVGGARPKVTLSTPSSLYLVKAVDPTKDTASNARLEEASMRMARAVGIQTADIVARQGPGFDFLVVRRFDAPDGGQGRRLQMLSAMSVLDADDQPFQRQNWSYPLLARALDRWSAAPAEDKLQLFRCMVLRAMLSDSDGHPRNYAVLRDPVKEKERAGVTLGQWSLAPLYDCVVGGTRGERAAELAMAIGRYGYEISERNIVSEAEAFGLSEDAARAEMKRIERAVLEEFDQVLADCGVDEAGRAIAQRAVAPLDERKTVSAIEALMTRMDADQGDGPETPTDPSVAQEIEFGLTQRPGRR